MPEQLPSHGCGGELKPVEVAIARNLGHSLFTFQNILGKRCSQCATEVIDRDTALALEAMEQESVQDFITKKVEVEHRGSVFTTNVPGIYFHSGTPNDTISHRNHSETALIANSH